MVKTLAVQEDMVLSTLVSWVHQVSGAGWGHSFGCVVHQQTLIQVGSSLSAQCPVNLEVWGRSPRTHTRLTDPLVGCHWWPPLIPEALAKKEPLGNHKDRTLKVVLGHPASDLPAEWGHSQSQRLAALPKSLGVTVAISLPQGSGWPRCQAFHMGSIPSSPGGHG